MLLANVTRVPDVAAHLMELQYKGRSVLYRLVDEVADVFQIFFIKKNEKEGIKKGILPRPHPSLTFRLFLSLIPQVLRGPAGRGQAWVPFSGQCDFQRDAKP